MTAKNIRLISALRIEEENRKMARSLTKEVDFDDIAFAALSLHLDGIRWTGDKKFKKGL
ncbi:MAG: PIN domain-containing protein [Cytophagales bacterium]|nr:PIN domain-containing protein [Cytophagales bacterium]